jgi:hypothetical protein
VEEEYSHGDYLHADGKRLSLFCPNPEIANKLGIRLMKNEISEEDSVMLSILEDLSSN